MKRLLLTIALLLACAFAQAQYVPAVYNSGATSFSQIRCSASQQYVSQTSFTVNFPSCATAGDLLLINFGSIVSGGNGSNSAPTGWSYSGGTFWSSCVSFCGGVYAKILTSADVSAGSQAWATIAAGNGTASEVEFIGTTGGFTIGDTAYVSSSNPATLAVTAPIAPVADDTVLFFGGCSCTTSVSSNLGTTLQSQTVVSGSGGANLATYVHYSAGAAAPTATFTMGTYSTNHGSYAMAVVVHGVQWTPRSIPGLQAWYAADCITMSGTTCQTPSTGTNPTAWYNESLYVTSAVTGGANVTFNTNQINSKPTVTFASTGSFVTLALPTDNEWVPNPNISYAGVWANTGSASKGTLFGGVLEAYTYWSCGSSLQQGSDSQNHALIGEGTAACDTSFHQANMEFIFGTSISFRIGEATDATQNPSVNPTNAPIYPSVIGKNQAAGSEFFNGRVAELMFYTHSLQASEITLLENYFHNKYGI